MATILVVDDQQESLDFLSDVLLMYQHTTLCASDGVTALDILSDQQVDLIISDILMPRMDGFQFLREVRSRSELRSTPFIFYTANYIDSEDAKFALSLGADEYILKPVDLTTLISVINSHLVHRTDVQGSEPQHRHDIPPESEYLREHNTLLIRKLQDKMAQLEQTNTQMALANRALEESHISLNESNERFRDLFQHASDAIFLIEPGSESILDANRQAEILTGRTHHDLLGWYFASLLKGKPTIQDNHPNFSFEDSILRADGEEVTVEISGSFIPYGTTKVVQLFVRDVSEQRRLHAELVQADKLASLGRISAGIAHEIRNPLAAININLQYLKRTLTEDPGMMSFVSTALAGVERIEKIVENTLNFARPTTLAKQPEDLNSIIELTLPFVRMDLQKKQVSLKLHLAQTLPPFSADLKQIQQVLLNIFQNAVDAIQERGEIEIETHRERGVVVVSVRDTGIGISQEDMKHIFDPFFTRKSDGTGLGLSVTQQIVEQHGGTISTESTPGRGTIFTIRFPAMKKGGTK